MKQTAKNGWMAVVMAFAFAAAAHGAMIGIGREGDFVLEVFAERSDVSREKGRTTVALPREAEMLCWAADLRKGDGVWTGDGTQGPPSASVAELVPRWRRCDLKFDEPGRPLPAAVERFHLLRWDTLGERFAAGLAALSRTNEAAYRTGLAETLGKVRMIFGGESMVAGFPGTRYEAEFRKIHRAFARCARRGEVRGFSADRALRERYREVFGAKWPAVLAGTFSSGDGRALEIVRVADADGRALPGVFDRPLPIRLEGTNRVAAMFPAGRTLQISYALAGDRDKGSEQAFSWTFPPSDGSPVWFVLQAGGPGERMLLSTNLLENAGDTAVSATVRTGRGAVQSCELPKGGKVLLCLVMRPGEAPQLNGAPAPSNAHARDWDVSARMAAPGVIRFDAVRKAQPGLVLNNPEMMPVDVTVAPAGAGRGGTTKLTLRDGETGVGIPVPAHKPLAVSWRFRSKFHKNGRIEIPPLFYGESSNLVLRAELKGDPEVTVRNTGTCAVRLSGMTGPAAAVDIPPGGSARVTVPAGRKTVLTGTAADSDWRCEPVSVAAMDSGESADVSLRMALKPSPQVVLRNAGGMMDVTATLVSGADRPAAKPVTVKRGTSSRPLVLPSLPGLRFRLTYGDGRFAAKGTLDVPAVPRGETKILDIPAPGARVGLPPPAAKPPAENMPLRPAGGTAVAR